MKYKLIISVIFVSALFLFSCEVLERLESNEDFIKKEVEKIKKDLPVTIDEATTLSDIEAGPDEIIFIYDVTGIDAGSVNSHMKTMFKRKIVSRLKTQPEINRIFARAIYLIYKFYDEDEYEIMTITVRPIDMRMTVPM